MVPQTSIQDVLLGRLYVVGHHFGPDYTGPSAGYHFVDGLIPGGLVSGADIRNTGLANITHYWAVLPNHKLSWNGEAWKYAPVVQQVVQPAAKPKIEVVQPVEQPAQKPVVKRRKKRGRK